MLVTLTEKDYKLIMQERRKHNLRCVRRFNRKKLNHLNYKKYYSFYKRIGLPLSPVLYEIRYKSSFTPYLYLFLKKKAKPILKNVESVSAMITVSFREIMRKSKMNHTTVKTAFEELVDIGLLLYTKQPYVPYNNAPRKAMLVNDEYVELYDREKHKIYYSMSKQWEI